MKLSDLNFYNWSTKIMITNFYTFSHNTSDLVRCCVTYIIGKNETLSITETLNQIQPFAADNEMDFKKQLAEQNINVIVRRNDTERIYGSTFIDHNSKTVWNGSRLSKELSANIFNDYWNNNIKPEMKEVVQPQAKTSQSNDTEDLPDEKPHYLFDFLNSPQQEDGLIEGLGGLLIPETQGEDYDELDFANRMKKKPKRKKQ